MEEVEEVEVAEEVEVEEVVLEGLMTLQPNAQRYQGSPRCSRYHYLLQVSEARESARAAR